MATDILLLRKIDRAVEPIPQASETVNEILERGSVLGATFVLARLVLLAKRVRYRLGSIESRLHHLDAIPDEKLAETRASAAKMDDASRMSRSTALACRRILDSGRRHPLAIRLLGHTLAEDLDWLSERLEDLAETLALSSHKPFTELVREELSNS